MMLFDGSFAPPPPIIIPKTLSLTEVADEEAPSLAERLLRLPGVGEEEEKKKKMRGRDETINGKERVMRRRVENIVHDKQPTVTDPPHTPPPGKKSNEKRPFFQHGAWVERYMILPTIYYLYYYSRI